MAARNKLQSAPPYSVEQALKSLGENLRAARLRRNLTIAEVAGKAKVNVFSRFALMKRWNEDNIPLEQLADGGQLHTSEWATKFIALALSKAIVGAPQAVA